MRYKAILCALFVCSVYSLNALPALATPVDAKCSGVVFPVKQGKKWGCWAASGAMMLGWKSTRPATISDTLNQVGGNYKSLYDTDAGLSGSEIASFIKALGLKAEPLQSYTVTAFADLVKSSPLYFVYNPDGTAANKVRHVAVVTRVKGDGTIDGTNITYIDPEDAKEYTESFKKFMIKYEAGENVDYKVQIGHY